MTGTITNEALLRFIYDETEGQESELIRKAIQKNLQLKEEYEQLLEIKKHLELSMLSPDDSIVEKIMDHSKKVSMHSYNNSPSR